MPKMRCEDAVFRFGGLGLNDKRCGAMDVVPDNRIYKEVSGWFYSIILRHGTRTEI